MSENQIERKSHALEKLHRKLSISKQRIGRELKKAFGQKTDKIVVVRLDFKEFDSMVAQQRENVENKGGTYLGSYIKIAKKAEDTDNRTIIHSVDFESYYEKDDKNHKLTGHIDRIEIDGLPEDVEAELLKKGKVKLKVEI